MSENDCAACHHDRLTHLKGKGICGKCGCYGFFPPNARHCDNPKCKGTNCTEARRSSRLDDVMKFGRGFAHRIKYELALVACVERHDMLCDELASGIAATIDGRGIELPPNFAETFTFPFARPTPKRRRT